MLRVVYTRARNVTLDTVVIIRGGRKGCLLNAYPKVANGAAAFASACPTLIDKMRRAHHQRENAAT